MSVDKIVNHLSEDSLAPLKCSFSQPPMFPRPSWIRYARKPPRGSRPDVAHPTEDGFAEVKIEMLKKVVGKVPLLKLE